VVANVINIGADLGGMAEATQLITGIRALIYQARQEEGLTYRALSKFH